MNPRIETPFREPPRPTRTLSQLRREDESAWRVLQWLIRQWIEQIMPETIPGDFGASILPGICPVLDGDIAGEAKLEAIEHLLDAGYLRIRISPPNRRGRFKYQMEVWTGWRYRMVGRGRMG